MKSNRWVGLIGVEEAIQWRLRPGGVKIGVGREEWMNWRWSSDGAMVWWSEGVDGAVDGSEIQWSSGVGEWADYRW